MSYIFRNENISFELNKSPIPEFAWYKSPKLSELVQSKHLHFDIKRLEPGKYSYPYHFHRNAEEIFVILSGKAMLRTPAGYEELKEGNMIFFEMGETGAHQLFNHTEVIFEYIDIRTEAGLDICEYPDSGKVNIIPYQGIYEKDSKVDYYKGEESIKEKWTGYGEQL